MADGFLHIKKSPTADTRTCDYSKVTKDTLAESSQQHIDDVAKGMKYFAALIQLAAVLHDTDKLEDLEGFHRDFINGFKTTGWWDNHRLVNRHHLDKPDGVREDVNLVDVLEWVVDCVMAGMARSGNVYELKIDSDVLQKAVANTANKLKAKIVVGD